MSVSFLRIDDRMIHGQTVTRWSLEYPCDGLIAVNDRAANTKALKMAYKSASTKKTFVWTYEAWKQIFNSAVAYWVTTPMNFSGFSQSMFSMEGTNGVSCYIPSTSNTVTDKAYRSTEWYTSAGFEKLGW